MATREDYVTAFVLSLPVTVSFVLIVLKLAGQLDWSWWCVTAPIWGMLGLLFVLFGIYALLLFIAVKREQRRIMKRG